MLGYQSTKMLSSVCTRFRVGQRSTFMHHRVFFCTINQPMGHGNEQHESKFYEKVIPSLLNAMLVATKRVKISAIYWEGPSFPL